MITDLDLKFLQSIRPLQTRVAHGLSNLSEVGNTTTVT